MDRKRMCMFRFEKVLDWTTGGETLGNVLVDTAEQHMRDEDEQGSNTLGWPLPPDEGWIPDTNIRISGDFITVSFAWESEG